MSRRLGVVGVIMIVLFLLLAGQTAYLQFWHAGALNSSDQNSRNFATQSSQRGDIFATDGTPLAHSVRSGNGLYPWQRTYPLGSLTAGVVGFSSNYYGTWALEAQYNSFLVAHKQPPESWAQVLAPISSADSITLTLQPALQRVAQTALAGRDGAVVAIDPRNGSILAMYSNPTYNPSLITSTVLANEQAAWKSYNTNDVHNFPPLGLVATQQTFAPGSTFKILTTASAIVHMPELMTKSYPLLTCTPLPNSNKQLCNDGGRSCGGSVDVMLPESCDPGYALMGLDLGGSNLSATANSFGYNAVNPLDLPGIVPSYFPPSGDFTFNQPQLAYSAIGQENVRATALQNALVAAGIANGGRIMRPHLMRNIYSAEGRLVQFYYPSVWRTPLTPSEAAQIVPLMQNVVRYGTASGVGFLPQDDVAAKTGTAQTGNSAQNTHDWMIAFAPASNPVIAIAVVVPYQAVTAYGATVAGPIVRCVIEADLALIAHLPPTNTATTCAR